MILIDLKKNIYELRNNSEKKNRYPAVLVKSSVGKHSNYQKHLFEISPSCCIEACRKEYVNPLLVN